MTRREMLMEQYENALFALLMDEVAESEGRKAIEENERLKERGEPVISDTSRQRCMKTIARKTTQQDVKRYGRVASRIITKVAVAALMAMLLFTTAFASSESFRIKTLNFVIDTFDDRTELSLVSGNAPSAAQTAVPQITVGWLPEGVVLTDEGRTDVSAWCQYEESGGAMVSVFFIDLTNGGWNADTETAEMQDIEVQGVDAYLIEDGDIIQVLWRFAEEPNLLCMVTGDKVDTRLLLEIAESVRTEE